MLEAYSQKLMKIICADEVTDFSDTFMCINRNCNAEYTVKAADSDIVSTHFCRKRLTPHINGCKYSLSSNSYIDNSNLIKNDIEDIYENSFELKASSGIDNNHHHNSNNIKTAVKRITTPKQLLVFCISNKLSTEYKNGIKVNNIILDERNICENANFQGIEGLRLLVGNTYRYDKVKKTIDIKISSITKNQKEVSLNATIYLSDERFREIVYYIFDTYNDFSNHSIAVLGIWENDIKYHVKCFVNKKSNVIYRFP